MKRISELYNRKNYDLSAGAIATYLRLAEDADKNNTVSLSYYQLATERQANALTIRNQVKDLTAAGLIKVIGRTMNGTNIYKFT